MDDDELAAERGRLLDEYVERLEYFATLPSWQRPENAKSLEGDPSAWGLTRSEYLEWCADLLEHLREGAKLADVRKERDRRLREAERGRVSALPDHDVAMAACEAHRPPRPCTSLDVLPGETIRDYVGRRERESDGIALWWGACDGLRELQQRTEREWREQVANG